MKTKYTSIKLALVVLLASQSAFAFVESELDSCRAAFRNLYRAGIVKDAVGFVDYLAKSASGIAQRGAYIRMVLTGAAFGFSDTSATSAQAEIFKNALFATAANHLTKSQIEASAPKAREAKFKDHFYALAKFEMQGMEASRDPQVDWIHVDELKGYFKNYWGVSLPMMVYVLPCLRQDSGEIARYVSNALKGLNVDVRPVNYDVTFPGLQDFAEGLMGYMPNITRYGDAQKLFADNKEQINALIGKGLNQLSAEIQAADTMQRNIFIYGESLGALVGSFLVPALSNPTASGAKAMRIGGAYLTMAIPFGLDKDISGNHPLDNDVYSEVALNDEIFNQNLLSGFIDKMRPFRLRECIIDFVFHENRHTNNGGNLLQKLRAQITKM